MSAHVPAEEHAHHPTPGTYAKIGLVLFVLTALEVGLYEFTAVHRLRPSLFSPLRLALSYLPYQWLLAFAALRAVWRQARGVNTWEKTAHVGAHRQLVAAAVASDG